MTSYSFYQDSIFWLWIALGFATLFYTWYRFRFPEFSRKWLLIRWSLLLLIPWLFLEAIASNRNSTSLVFVLLDTSKSMQSFWNQQMESAENSGTFDQFLQEKYPTATLQYFDLFSGKSSAQWRELIPLSENDWSIQSRILDRTMMFLQQKFSLETFQFLLITDGQDTQYSHIPESLKASFTSGQKLDLAYFQTSLKTNEMMIAEVNSPDIVFMREPVQTQVRIHYRVSTPQTSYLILTDGDAIITRKKITFSPEQTEQWIDVEWVPEKIGRLILNLRVVPFAEEKYIEDNIRYVPINSRASKMKVLHIAGRPSWDVRYLRSTLKTLPEMDLISFYILRDPVEDLQNVAESELSLIQFPVRILFQRELFKFDTVIFHNFAMKKYLQDSSFQQSFQKYLSDGGHIVVVGGEQALGQTMYQDLFLKAQDSKNGTLAFTQIPSHHWSHSKFFSQSILQKQPALEYVGSPLQEELPSILKRTYFNRGSVNWVAEPASWQWQHESDQELGQSGHFATFWHTLLYQSVHTDEHLFQEFQKSRPYSSNERIQGTLHLYRRDDIEREEVNIQIVDTLSNLVVFENIFVMKKGRIEMDLSPFPPSTYQMRIRCQCEGVRDFFFPFVVVKDWLEKQNPFPNLRLLQGLVKLTGGSLSSISEEK